LQFDPHRRDAESDEGVLFLEQLRRECVDGEAEFTEDGNEPAGIVRVRRDPEIHVAGGSRISVEGHGVTTDQQILNAGGVE